MPRRRSSPPPTMTWGRALPIVILAGVFDLIRIMFEMFWFFGPLLLAVGTGAVASNYVGAWAGTKVGALVGATAGTFGWWGFEIMGVVLAMASGIIGWLTIGLLLFVTNPRIFKANAMAFFWMMVSLGIAEMPIIGSIPSMTGATIHLYRVQIRKEKAALKKWKTEEEASQKQDQQEQVAQFLQAREAQVASEDIEEIPEEIAAPA